MIRLDKLMAQADVTGRKKARTLIRDGLVTVNDEVITDPAVEVDENNDCVVYENRQLKSMENVYYVFHKPAGCITAKSDIRHKTVMEYFKEEDKKGIFPVGRLDMDTEGLLLFTNDGTFEHALMHPKHHVDKTYFFWSLGSLSKEQKETIERGVDIGDDTITSPAKLVIEEELLLEEAKSKYGYEFFRRDQYKKLQMVTSGYLTISEGRKHQVKRMLKAMGCFVIYLKRIQIGTLVLDDSLKRGEYRPLTREERENLL